MGKEREIIIIKIIMIIIVKGKRNKLIKVVTIFMTGYKDLR